MMRAYAQMLVGNWGHSPGSCHLVLALLVPSARLVHAGSTPGKLGSCKMQLHLLRTLVTPSNCLVASGCSVMADQWIIDFVSIKLLGYFGNTQEALKFQSFLCFALWPLETEPTKEITFVRVRRKVPMCQVIQSAPAKGENKALCDLVPASLDFSVPHLGCVPIVLSWLQLPEQMMLSPDHSLRLECLISLNPGKWISFLKKVT